MIRVFNIEFKSLRALLRLLGYNAVMSQNSIKKYYGSIEQMISQRLNIEDHDLIHAKLLELKRANENLAINSNSIDPVCFAVLRAIYMQCDENLRNTVIATIASVNNINANELKQKIDQTLK